MHNTDLKDIARTWFHAFNTKDIDLLLSLYDDQAQHYSPKLKLKHPETKGLIKGKQALYDWWNEAFVHMPELRYEILTLMSDEDKVFMEYLRYNTGDPTIQVGEVLAFNNGKIIASRVYHS